MYIKRAILPDYLNGTLLYVYEFMNFNTKEKKLQKNKKKVLYRTFKKNISF